MTKTLLENNWLRLDLLDPSQGNALWEVLTELDIYKFSPNNLSSKDLLDLYILNALKLYKEETAIPLAIFDKKKNKYVGSSRFGYIDHTNRSLHIGWTWISLESQGSGLNTNLKDLMLKEAFGPMNMRKVIFRVDALNLRSRRAVEKLGATLEGVLKKDVYVKDQRLRDSCCYAIFKEDFEGQ